MAAVESLGGRRDDRVRQLLVLVHAVGQGDAVDLALALLVHRPDRGAGGAGQVIAHDDLDRHDVQPAAHDHVGIGIVDHVVRADVGRLLEPEAGDLGQRFPFERHGGQDAVERAQAVARDDDAPPVGQVVVVPHLAPVMIGQFRYRRVAQHVAEMRLRNLLIHHRPRSGN